VERLGSGRGVRGVGSGFSAITLVVWPLAHKRHPRFPHRVASVLIPAALAGVVAVVLSPLARMVSVPLILAAAAVVALRLSPRHLRQVGWAVAAAGTTAALLVVAAGLALPLLLSSS
jgi:hypothetical protein